MTKMYLCTRNNDKKRLLNSEMMTIAFREIVRLWLRQKRHDFHWQQIFMSVYFGGLYVAMLVGFYFGLREELSSNPVPLCVVALLPMLAVSVQLSDLLIKLFWRRSPVEMDDYLRTRPVPPKDWSLFILLDTSLGFLQWMLALMLGSAALLVLPWWAGLLLLVLTFSISMVNALFQNCWRRAPGNEWTLPLVFGYLIWTALMWVLVVVALVRMVMLMDGFSIDEMKSVDHATLMSCLTAGFGASAALLCLNGLVLWLLHRYFMRMKNHNEEAHAPVSASHVRSLGKVSLWSIEWVQLLRSKRLRTSFLVIVVVFLLNTYLQQQSTIQNDFGGVNLMLLFGVAFPSIILAQWVLGIEANFFGGIWTKPWPVEGILLRKYYFFCAICGVMALFILPCVLFMGMSPWMWLMTLLFSCGCFVLPFMATCLFSSRMDLFSSAFFNYQGGNKQLNVFSFIMFIPIGIYYASYFLLPHLWAHLIVGGLGLLGLLLHQSYIRWISNIWHRRRYEIMERWQTE